MGSLDHLTGFLNKIILLKAEREKVTHFRENTDFSRERREPLEVKESHFVPLI